jgi:hypothetical protein
MQDAQTMGAAITSMRVSKENLAELMRFKEALGVSTADEALQLLLKRRRLELVRSLYGSLRGQVRPFTEDDRVETDS